MTSISYLPKRIVLSPKLKQLDASGCPLVFPPVEIYQQGVPAMRQYFIESEKTIAVRRGRLKILVMGVTMAGKTSLVKALVKGESFLTGIEDRTIGVIETVIRIDDKREWKVIDCGGHKAYMLTNQLMVSDNALALIVVDSSRYDFSEHCFRQNVGDFLEVLYERNTRARVVFVVSKVDEMSRPRQEINAKWNEHLATRLAEFLKMREDQINRMAGIAAPDGKDQSDYLTVNLQFLRLQQITIEKKAVVTSAATYEGVEALKSLLEMLSQDVTLLPSLEARVPESWATVEDKLVIHQADIGVPITQVSDAIALGDKHGLAADDCHSLLNYLHQAGSILYYSRLPVLSDVLFPSSSSVVNLLKCVFRHDHQSLSYDSRFASANIAPQQFEAMKRDLVSNGIARISMLLALWSEFAHINDRHVDVFIRLFLALDFAYLTAPSEEVLQNMPEDVKSWTFAIDTNVLSRQQLSSTSSLDVTSASDADRKEAPQWQTDKMEKFISYLISNDVGLLLPWLLAEEKPSDVRLQWPIEECRGVMQVVVKYSFAYNCPLGLFERLSARCHRHSNYVRHWRNGFLLCYGSVTLLCECSRGSSSGSVSLHGRVPSSRHSAARLWHVLIRCMSDLEDLLTSIPGALVDRNICDVSSSLSSQVGLFRQANRFRPSSRWPPFVVDLVAGRYSREMCEHIRAIEQGKH